MRILKFLLILVLLGLTVSCRRHDNRKAMISVPEMTNKACADVIGKALSRAAGIKKESIVLDLKKRRVTLVYNSITLSLKNVEFIVAKAGFKANGVPADPGGRAALPPECGFEVKKLSPAASAVPVKSVK